MTTIKTASTCSFIKELLKKQQQYIDFFFQQIDIEKMEEIFDRLWQAKGWIVFTGVGKSGIIAQKVAMSFLSTGTKALYMPPTDLMHGDLGVFSENDLFLCFSKSGNTEELLRLLPYVKDKGATTIALVSNKQSRLYQSCDLAAYLPVLRELCPFDLAPTTSTEVQLLYGDLLAVAMMYKNKFSLQEFAKNHPAGGIGKRLLLKVEDLMLTQEALPLCASHEQLLSVLCLLSEKKCGCVLIVDKNTILQGIFTDGDLSRSIEKWGGNALEKTMAELMTNHPKFTIKSYLASKALDQMEEDPNKLVTVLPVLEDKKVVGLIRMHDILQSL